MMRRLSYNAARRIRSALYLIIVCALLAACVPPSGSRGQVIIAWHTLTGSKEQVLLNLVDQWNRTNPDGITVVPERHSAAMLHQSVLEGIRKKALPALMLVSPMQAAIYHQNGILTPLDNYIEDSSLAVGWGPEDRTDLYPFILKAGRASNGQIVGIPFGGVARVMLYNRDWLRTLNFDNAPANWDQLTGACNAATDRARGTLCFGIDPNSVSFEQWLYAYGGQVTTDDLSVLQLSTPAAMLAMNRLAELVRASQAYRVTSREQSRDDFATARVLFMFDWSNNLADDSAAIKQHAEFDWGVGMLAGDTQRTATNYSAPLWVVTRAPGQPNPDREKASWLFIRWLSDPAQTAQWAAQTGELPARLSATNLLTTGKSLSANELSVLQSVAPAAHPEPIVSGLNCVGNAMSDGIRQILDGKPVTPTLLLVQATGQPQLQQDCSSK